MRSQLGRAARVTARRIVPLGMRKRVAVWLSRRPWNGSYYWTMELLRDFADRDPNAFHRFLWANHLAYAETYEVAQRFTPPTLHPTRELLLQDLEDCLARRGVTAVESVLDVGCSLGYVLRRIETDVFPDAARLDGIDIDAYAVAQGAAHLKSEGSRVRLAVADLSTVDQVFGSEPYDVVLSAGVLMYLARPDAQRVVRRMLERTRGVLVLTGLAHADVDNANLPESTVRERDGTFIHNLDAMIIAAGGHVIRRRWEGARQMDGNTIYFVFAAPNPGAATTPVSSGMSVAAPQ